MALIREFHKADLQTLLRQPLQAGRQLLRIRYHMLQFVCTHRNHEIPLQLHMRVKIQKFLQFRQHGIAAPPYRRTSGGVVAE
ncbi:hypothetical protein D3C81_2213230 [compost metagenome]